MTLLTFTAKTVTWLMSVEYKRDIYLCCFNQIDINYITILTIKLKSTTNIYYQEMMFIVVQILKKMEVLVHGGPFVKCVHIKISKFFFLLVNLTQLIETLCNIYMSRNSNSWHVPPCIHLKVKFLTIRLLNQKIINK